MSEWIGVDLDGTLAHSDVWSGIETIGLPVPKMLQRVKRWIDEGKKVKIMTARVSGPDSYLARIYIRLWLLEHLNSYADRIEITNAKDMDMIELWDDRVVQVITNTGERVDGGEDGFCSG